MAEYRDIMMDRLTVQVIALCIFVALIIGFMIFLFCHYKEVVREQKYASSQEEMYEAKKDKKKIIAYATFVSILCCCAAPTIIKNFYNHIYDIKNEAYILVEGSFVVESATYGWGRFSDDVYTLTYEKDGKSISTDIVTTECSVASGRYSNAVLIYSSRAKIVLFFDEHPSDD